MKADAPPLWAAMKLSRVVAQARLISVRMSGSASSCTPDPWTDWPGAARSIDFRRSRSFRKGLDRGPKTLREFADLGTREKLAFEEGKLCRKLRIPSARSINERARRSISPRSGWLGIGPHLLEEGSGGGYDPVQEIGVGAVEPEQRRKFSPEFLVSISGFLACSGLPEQGLSHC